MIDSEQRRPIASPAAIEWCTNTGAIAYSTIGQPAATEQQQSDRGAQLGLGMNATHIESRALPARGS